MGILEEVKLIIAAIMTAIALGGVGYGYYEHTQAVESAAKLQHFLDTDNSKVFQAQHITDQQTIADLQQQNAHLAKVLSDSEARNKQIEEKSAKIQHDLTEALNDPAYKAWRSHCLPSALIYGVYHEPPNPLCPSH